MVIILKQVFHSLPQQYRVLLVNAHKNQKFKEFRVNVVFVLKLQHVLNDFLIVFLLGVQCNSFEQRSVHITTKINTIFGEDVASH